MAAKSVQVSTDGVTYNTLPGQNGQWDDTLSTLEDTVFGQNYKSIQPGLISAKITSDAFYKGFAGYNATIKAMGATTAFATEAFTLVSGKTYKITNTVKQIWDRTVTLTVFDNAVDKTFQVATIDYLFGQVTFLSTYTVVGAVTATGSYFPTAALAQYRAFTLTQQANMIETSDLPTMQTNSGIRTFSSGLKTLSLQVDAIYKNSAPAYRTYITNRTEVIIELSPDGGGKTVARGFFKAASRKQSGKVGELELETVMFDLFVPTTLTLSQGGGASVATLLTPFEWVFTATDLSVAVQQVLNAFVNGTNLFVKYLPDGGTTAGAGLAAAASFVENCTLTGGFDAMNLFNVSLQISGAVTTV